MMSRRSYWNRFFRGYIRKNFFFWHIFPPFYVFSSGVVPIFNSSNLSFVIKTSLGLLPWYPEMIPLSSINIYENHNIKIKIMI